MGLLDWALRPLAFRSPTVGSKGVCHLIRWGDEPLVLASKLMLARSIGVTHVRGPMIEPWMDGEDTTRALHVVFDALQAAGIEPLVEIGYGTQSSPEFNLVGEWARFIRWVGREFPAPA